MFEKILIANRGEIACRVIRTARRLGIQTVAVYSEADARALHVELADEAYPIGPAPARESYLAIDRILDAARRSHAQAIHPGYGFLSENPEFAKACAAARVTFIGPPESAIRAMGSKSAAKTLMENSGVPLVPGYHGDAQDFATLAKAAERIGYPVLIKASAGGGGKGMRVVEQAADLEAAIASAKREAASSFGNDQILIEKYLAHPRHIEIQIFGDAHGNIVYLFERDCSIQRRHQKVIEEAPAPGMTATRRKSMGEAAVAAARAIGYVNAGTVEFLSDGDAFYFMEMNTRLQVEHPVTEFVTGQDLVEWQLIVAAGGELPKTQKELAIHGHAIEARVYAEEPARDFRPSTGILVHVRPPERSAHVRVDTGVRAGDSISVHYDPMIAKLIVWDADRERAIQRLRRALADYEVVGVSTNLAFLRAIAATAAFSTGEVDTGFIGRHAAELFCVPKAPPRAMLAAAVLRALSDRQRESEQRALASGDPWSPWSQLTAWRMNGEGRQDLVFRDGESTIQAHVHRRGHGAFEIELPDGAFELAGTVAETGAVTFRVDGVQMRATVVRRGSDLTVLLDGSPYPLKLIDPLAPAGSEQESKGHLMAPMPGRITQVLTRKGAEVKRGTPLLVMEAMKMEYTITAPADGKVEEVRYQAGDVVDDGAELISFAAAPAS